MNCCTNSKYQKSSLKTYNSATQTVTAAVTPIEIAGSTCTDTGCSLAVNGSGNVQINNSGLYYLAADVTFTPTAAGTEIIQLYKDGVALPCAIAQETAEADNAFTVHAETVLHIASCCAVKPQISVRTSGTDGDVNFVGFTAIKLA